MTVYESGAGDELVNPYNYNQEISSYLKEEEEILSRLAMKYETVIEAGCMNGRYTKLILSLGRKYIGIDIVERYIESANKKYEVWVAEREAAFFCVGLEKLSSVPEIIRTINSSKTITVFPFNSFGNIKNIAGAIDCLCSVSMDFAIFTYKTNDLAKHIRADYYRRSGFLSLDCTDDELGVRFKSPEGLDSVAYTEKYLKEKFEEKGRDLQVIDFGTIGILFQSSIVGS